MWSVVLPTSVAVSILSGTHDWSLALRESFRRVWKKEDCIPGPTGLYLHGTWLQPSKQLPGVCTLLTSVWAHQTGFYSCSVYSDGGGCRSVETDFCDDC